MNDDASQAVQSLMILFSGQTEKEDLKLKLPETSAVFQKPLSTPPLVLKLPFYGDYNQGMMMGSIGPDDTLPAYEDLVPFNFELYKLIATNTISLLNAKQIQNVDWYNLNLLAYVSSKNTF